MSYLVREESDLQPPLIPGMSRQHGGKKTLHHPPPPNSLLPLDDANFERRTLDTSFLLDQLTGTEPMLGSQGHAL